CGSSSIARNVFPTTLLGMAVGPPFCLAYFHTAPGEYNVGLRTPLFARRRSQRVETHFATKARLPAPARRELGAGIQAPRSVGAKLGFAIPRPPRTRTQKTAGLQPLVPVSSASADRRAERRPWPFC